MAGEIIRRPDLEAQEVSFPDYIGTKIYPWLGRSQIAGKLYYQKYKSDISAQVGRNTAALASITDNVIAANDESFSCSEVRARVKMGYTERMGYYDNEHADLAAGRLAKRAFFNKVEALCAGNLIDADTAIDATADPVTAIDTNVALLRDCGIGRVALVTSNHNKVALKKNATIIERMKSTGLGAYDLKEIRNVGDMNLAAALGVDEILTGKDQIWFAGMTGADKDCVALAVLPDDYDEPAESIQLGRLIYFMFTDSADDRFVMESWVDAYVDANVVDCKGLMQIKEFNSELRKTLKLFNNEDSSSSN